MRRAGFTLIELILAVSLVGVLTALATMTFNAVTSGWQISTDYMDKMQRTDFALNQLISGLRSMYYPHDGKQDYNYGFMLTNNGDGEDPDDSDVIEWSKTGTAIVGNKSSVADTVHRVQVMVLEEGNRDYRQEILVTGLYARQCPDSVLRPQDEDDGPDDGYGFDNAELYQPVLIADGIVGFNCRVIKTVDDAKTGMKGESDEKAFEDEYDASNAVPYKVELTFRVADPEGKSYRSNTAPIMRIIRLPIHEQSLDGATTPDDEEGGKGNDKGGGKGGGRGGGRRPPPVPGGGAR